MVVGHVVGLLKGFEVTQMNNATPRLGIAYTVYRLGS